MRQLEKLLKKTNREGKNDNTQNEKILKTNTKEGGMSRKNHM